MKSESLNSNLDLRKIFTQAEINREINRINNGQDISQNFIKKLVKDISE